MNSRVWYFILVLSALIAYLVSLASPLITVNKLLFFSDTITLISVLIALLENRELILFVIIFIFTIILPSVKFLLLIAFGLNPHIDQTHKKSFLLLEQISKWAMLDVFVAALLIVIVKLGLLSSANTHYGLYLFVFSVLLSMLCSQTRKYWFSNNKL